MQYAKVYLTAGLVLTVLVTACELGIGRIPVGETRATDVASLPRHIGQWKAVSDVPVDPDLSKQIPSAKIIERVYRGKDGRPVDVLLLTATDPTDFHDPTVCLPSQGWATQSSHDFDLNGYRIHQILAKTDTSQLNIIYWLIGDYASKRTKNPLLAKLYKIRSRFVIQEEGTCMMVRVITHGDDVSAKDAMQVVDDLQGPLAHLDPLRTKVASRG